MLMNHHQSDSQPSASVSADIAQPKAEQESTAYESGKAHEQEACEHHVPGFGLVRRNRRNQHSPVFTMIRAACLALVLFALPLGAVSTAVTTRVSSPTATGTQDITLSGVGTPIGYRIRATRASTDATASASAGISIGFSDGTRQGAIAIFSRDAQPTIATARVTESDLVVSMYGSTGVNGAWEAAHSAFITDGVRINWTTVQNPDTILLEVTMFFGGSFYVDQLTQTATLDGAVSLTAPAFTPDVAFFIGDSNSSAFDGANTIARATFGFATRVPAFQAAISFNEDTALADSAPFLLIQDDYAAQRLLSSGADQAAQVTSWDANGITVATKAVGGRTEKYFVAMWKLDSGTSLGAGFKDSPTSTGDAAATNESFTLSFLDYWITHAATDGTIESDGDAGAIGFGSADGTRQYCSAIAIEDAQATSDTQSWSDDTFVSVPLHDGTTGMTGSLTSLASGGTVNWTAVLGGAKKILYLGIGPTPAAASGQNIIGVF